MRVIDDWDEFDDNLQVAPKAAATAPKQTVVATSNNKTYEETMDDIEKEYADNHATTFNDVESIANRVLASMKKLEYAKLRNEMSNMHVEIHPNPTTFQLLEALATVQGYKTRLAEISNDVEHEYNIRKRVNDMLFDANQAVSKQSSADKRKGEAAIRYPVQIMQLETINSFRIEVNNYIKNMQSTGEMLSRQASLIQMQLSLGEYRKKLPNEFGGNEAEEKLDYKPGVSEMEWTDSALES